MDHLKLEFLMCSWSGDISTLCTQICCSYVVGEFRSCTQMFPVEDSL